MKYIFSLLFVIAIFYSNNNFAQDATSNSIIAKLTQKIKTAKSIKSGFTLHIKNSKNETKSTMNGTMVLKGNMYMVDLGEQKLYNDGKTVYTYLVNNKEVQIANYNPHNDAISPSKLFNGNISSEYSYRYVGEQTFNGKRNHVIQLNPKKANKLFTKVILFVDKNTNFVNGGNVFEKNGNYYQYIINNVYTTNDFADTYFRFDPAQHKGVEIIDLR